MEDPNGQQTENLEDQLRRMILKDASSQPNQADTSPHFQPNVRLPTAAAYKAPQQSQVGPTSNQYGTPQPWQGGTSGFPRDPSIIPSPNHRGSNFPNRQPQNGRPPNVQHPGTFRHQGFRQHPQGYNDNGNPTFDNIPPHQRARFQRQMPIDPNAFHRGYPNGPQGRHSARPQQLFNPNMPRGPMPTSPADQHFRQAQYLEQIAAAEISNVEMSLTERDEKDSFRLSIQQICHEVCETNRERLPHISLECFGSFQSGFATAGSDMDLVIVVKDTTSASACFSLHEDDLPRALEKRLLQLGYGARLLTRTRVPIIKICEKPDAEFLDKLREEREKWDDLPEEKKYPHLYPDENDVNKNTAEHVPVDAQKESNATTISAVQDSRPGEDTNSIAAVLTAVSDVNVLSTVISANEGPNISQANGVNEANRKPQSVEQQRQRRDQSPPWTRERKAGPLDFPKSGVGIQSDINFFNPLGIHNTHLLRCYSLCDPRVRPMVLFIKAWVKRRKINSSYSGTLSSYGYVLMVLHYLVNIAQPPVLPNLQASWRPRGYEKAAAPSGELVNGWQVDFWRNEHEITYAAQQGLLTANREPLGALLAGFFYYYASQGGGQTFTWTQEVLSLRTIDGVLTKEEKSWTKAVTEEAEGKRIQHRYLFCIEDPFELNHNVARTVTHKGIVAIRDEFRRARRILQAIGDGLLPKDGDLFSQLVEAEDFQVAAEDRRANAGRISNFNDGKGNAAARSETIQNNASAGQAHSANQGFNNNVVYPRGSAPNPRNNAAGKFNNNNKLGTVPPPKTKALDVNDNDAFPSLGATKSPKKKRTPRHTQNTEEWSEISGEKAKRFLEEVKMKKDDAQMETTATGAAEAVLRDLDSMMHA